MDIATSIATVNAAFNLTSLFINERDRLKAAAIKIDLTEKIIEAQAHIFQIQRTIIEQDGLIQTLTERNRDLERHQADHARYRLTKVGTVGDFFAYELVAGGEGAQVINEPAHFVCQPCLDIRKQKSVLVFRGSDCTCPTCKASFAVKENLATYRRNLSRGIDTSGF